MSDQLTRGDLKHPVMRWSMYDTINYDSLVNRLVNEGKITEDNEDAFRETFRKAYLSQPLKLAPPPAAWTTACTTSISSTSQTPTLPTTAL